MPSFTCRSRAALLAHDPDLPGFDVPGGPQSHCPSRRSLSFFPRCPSPRCPGCPAPSPGPILASCPLSPARSEDNPGRAPRETGLKGFRMEAGSGLWAASPLSSGQASAEEVWSRVQGKQMSKKEKWQRGVADSLRPSLLAPPQAQQSGDYLEEATRALTARLWVSARCRMRRAFASPMRRLSNPPHPGQRRAGVGGFNLQGERCCPSSV